MKQIINWKKASVCDIESDGLLDTISKIHIVGIKLYDSEDVLLIDGKDHARVNKMLDYHIDNQIPIVGHNFIGYDVPAMEIVLGRDLSELMVIDTLYLSYYLNTNHRRHSIEALSADYPEAVEKFQVDEGGWENLSWEDAVKRVTPDVQINDIVWQDFILRLTDMYSVTKIELDSGAVGGTRTHEGEEIYIDKLKELPVEGHISRILTFLMFKADCTALQEKTKWEVDVSYLEKSYEELSALVEETKTTLESVMPNRPKYVARKPPTRPFKKNGELSIAGERWETVKELLRNGGVDEHGNPMARVVKEGEIQELTGYTPPNVGSHEQVKDFLFSKGWKPQTFNYVRDKEAFDEWVASKPEKGSFRGAWSAWSASRPEDRAIPQINREEDGVKELCESIEELADVVPEVMALANYSIIVSRMSVIKGSKDNKGWLNNLVDGKYLRASTGGLANTLRFKHRGITNLPKSDKPFADSIRGSLIAGEGNVSIGSDMSGLENRVGHHFMLAHDPEYVETMLAEDYDPHLSTAVASGFISQEDYDKYQAEEGDSEWREWVAGQRASGKTLNYALIYGSGVNTIVRGSNLTVEEATAGRKGYWELNWSVETIAKEQVVIRDSKGGRWLINPVNGFLYSVRTDKDVFSTLAQGTGSFLFDMWVDRTLGKMMEKWGKKTLTAQFHK